MVYRFFLVLSVLSPAFSSAIAIVENPQPCLSVIQHHADVSINGTALRRLEHSGISGEDVFTVLRIVAGYETAGCWNKAAGNADGQWLSQGVMQWNLGQGTLQPLLITYMGKFANDVSFRKDLAKSMPEYGKDLFSPSCLTKPILISCKRFLNSQCEGKQHSLSAVFRSQLDALFATPTMRQVQMDAFIASMSGIVDDLERVFKTEDPQPWQVAWAMDMKTQQGHFPHDADVVRVKKMLEKTITEKTGRAVRTGYLLGIIEWYEGLCMSGSAEGIQSDVGSNKTTWSKLIVANDIDELRQEALHFTFLVSRTAVGKGGTYQADAFQRRASIVFGEGSVHKTYYYFFPHSDK